MATKTQLRTLNDISNDMVLPGCGLGQTALLQSQRYAALVDVLLRMPEDDYRRLVDMIDDFEWFIPDDQIHGMNCPLRATVFPEKEPGSRLQPASYAHTIYLSPLLETWACDTVIAVVAHELAHFILGHSLWTQPKQNQDQEADVFQRICAWGFEKEAKKYRAVCKRLDTREESTIRKLRSDPDLDTHP